MDVAQVVNVTASGGIAVTALTVVVVYHVKAKWWQSAWGWNVMTVTVAVGLLGLYTVLVTLVWPAGPVTAVLRICRTVVLLVLGGALVQRAGLMLEPPPRKDDRRK